MGDTCLKIKNKDKFNEFVEKRKYENTVSECNNLRTFIKSVVGENITILKKKEYDHVRIEYGEIINTYQISNSDDAIDDVLNVYKYQKFPDRKRGEFLNSLITDNDRNLVVSSNSYRN